MSDTYVSTTLYIEAGEGDWPVIGPNGSFGSVRPCRATSIHGNDPAAFRELADVLNACADKMDVERAKLTATMHAVATNGAP